MIVPGIEFWLSLAAEIVFFLIVSLTLNLQFGYTGLPNFGVILGIGGGGLAAGIVSRILPQWILGIHGDSVEQNAVIVQIINSSLLHNPTLGTEVFVITLTVAAVVGAAVGVLASLPAIRLREDNLAIMLYVLGYFVQVVGQEDYFIAGGTDGLIIPDPFVSLGVNRFLVVTLITVAVCLVFLVYLGMLGRSPLARSLKSIRDNEITAASVGRNLVTYRLKAMAMGSAIAGIAGGLYIFYSLSISGQTFTSAVWSFYPWLILILGGTGRNRGVVVGAAVVMTMQQFIDFYEPFAAPYLPFSIVYVHYLLLGVLLIIIMIFRPKGLIPERAGITIQKTSK